MIAALYQWLTTEPKKTTTWYQADTPEANDPNTDKPYGIIEPLGLVPQIGGFTAKQEAQLHLIFPAGSWAEPMEAAEELRKELNNQLLTRVEGGERFRVEWESTIGGIHDTVLDAFINTVIFTIPIKA